MLKAEPFDKSKIKHTTITVKYLFIFNLTVLQN